ncbi:hypothetical protein [Paenibacillus qinlingensis]|uniref:hypothetical protein n=1 Tax=Paenibacillus qinlingensis TaxID=1837343 RepID=UPI001565CFB5|nr:hypothetical protein [Paenibacillus qinlingensis]NQX64213.1 hypothetical protein [Paenibacillus qinlingensis]
MSSLRLLQDHYSEEVVELILSFQHNEFTVNRMNDEVPDNLDYQTRNVYDGRNLWVTLKVKKRGNTVEQLNTHDIFHVKKLFIYIENQGIELSFKQEVFDVILEYAWQQGATTIYLDTPSIAKKSLHFFEKNGLIAITKHDLPIRYDYPDRNSLFHRLDFIS